MKNKILELIQKWAMKFEKDQDILPLFFQVYTALKNKGLAFPEYKADAPKPAPAPAPARSSTSTSKTGKAAVQPKIDPKFKKVKEDLEVVHYNIEFVNQMIDAHNPRDDVSQNEALVDVVQTLQSMETKLMNLITGMKDEGMMAFTLTLNDDLQKTLSRFKRLKSGRKPEPFIPSLPPSDEFKKGQ